MDDRLKIADKEFSCRLFLGTGKYRSFEEMNGAFEASGAELITVALRRLDLSDSNKKTLLDEIDWSRYSILPNTAGCATADEAVRTARLAQGHGAIQLGKAGGDPGLQIPATGSHRDPGGREAVGVGGLRGSALHQ